MVENMSSEEVATRLLNSDLMGAIFDPEHFQLEIIDNCIRSCKLIFRYDWQHRTSDPEEYAVILNINHNRNRDAYDIIITEDLGDQTFYAKGSITKDADNQILVNGVIEGTLTDRYGDGFLIHYDRYSHILNILNLKF